MKNISVIGITGLTIEVISKFLLAQYNLHNISMTEITYKTSSEKCFKVNFRIRNRKSFRLKEEYARLLIFFSSQSMTVCGNYITNIFFLTKESHKYNQKEFYACSHGKLVNTEKVIYKGTIIRQTKCQKEDDCHNPKRMMENKESYWVKLFKDQSLNSNFLTFVSNTLKSMS